MNRVAAAALYRRRGSLVKWRHAIPIAPASIVPIVGVPAASLGGPQAPAGSLGEQFCAPVIVRAYFSQKQARVSGLDFGVIDAGDGQLDFAVPYSLAYEPGVTADLAAEGAEPSSDDYDFGRFVRLAPGGLPVAFDRFEVGGVAYVAKAKAVPIVDKNETVAWRLVLTRLS